MVDIWIARQPPGFAFVTMEDEKEASEAVKELEGANVAGERIRVEVSKGGEPRRNPPPRNSRSLFESFRVFKKVFSTEFLSTSHRRFRLVFDSF